MAMESADFQIIKLIGQGAYGKVYAALHTSSNMLVAIKQISQSSNALYEYSTLYYLSHKCILSPIGYYYDISKSQYFIVQRLCITDLDHYFKKFPHDKSQLLLLFCDVLLGIIYLHYSNIIHRDIKAANVLLQLVTCYDKKKRYRACLTDFGMSVKTHTGEYFVERVGTPYYCAPEILQNKPHDMKVDSWSMGILLYYLMTGMYSVPSDDPNALEKLTRGYVPDLSVLEPLPKMICAKLLIPDPQYRCSPRDLMNIKALERVCRTRLDYESWDETFGIYHEKTALQRVLNGEKCYLDAQIITEWKKKFATCQTLLEKLQILQQQ